MKNKSLKPLAFTFYASGIWDTIAAILYFFVIGTGRIIDNPPIDPFFAVFLGSFFLCFAWLFPRSILDGMLSMWVASLSEDCFMLFSFIHTCFLFRISLQHSGLPE
jgi:hypothetical protein